VVLIGHSLGGHLAACYASMNPEKINKVTLTACSTPRIGAYTGKIKIAIKAVNDKFKSAQLDHRLMKLKKWVSTQIISNG
jgi:pimeloyl-ACP methyl ester carboxylesterase